MAAENDTGDLLMLVVPKAGAAAIDGESSSVLTPGVLMRGFKKGKYFEISDFNFSIESLKKVDHKAMAAKMGVPVEHVKAMFASPSNTGDAQSCPIQPVTFTRPIDRGSAVLMQLCVDSKTAHGAVVIKRKPAGGMAAGEIFLRLEFIGVLFTEVGWDNGQPVKEKCSFIARAVNVKYRPQLPDGSLGAVVSGSWSRIPNQSEELSLVA